MKCPSCGKENNGEFCTNCGTRIVDGNEFINIARKPTANVLGILGTILGAVLLIGAIVGGTRWSATAVPLILSFLGLILSNKNKWKKPTAIIGLCISVLALFIMYGNSIPSAAAVTPTTFSIEKQVIYNSNNIVITATGLDDTIAGPAIDLSIQNNSSYNLNFQSKYLAINGLMVNSSMYTSVASGKMVSNKLVIAQKSLNDLNIKKIGSIDVLIWAYNNATNMYLLDTGTLHMETNAGAINQKSDYSGNVLYSEKGITVEYLGKEEKGADGIVFSVENTNDVQYAFDINSISANDCMLSDHSATYADGNIGSGKVLPGAKDIITIEVNSDDIQKYAFTSINKYEFSIAMRPKEDYFSEYETSPLTVNIG